MGLNDAVKAKLVAKNPYECIAKSPGRELKVRHKALAIEKRRAEKSLATWRSKAPPTESDRREQAATIHLLERKIRGLIDEMAEVEKAALRMAW